MFVEHLTAAGFELRVQEYGIAVSPASELTAAQRDFIRKHKPQLMDELKLRDLHEALEEKAAVLEYEAGMPRDEAEARAPEAVGAYNYTLVDRPDKVFTLLARGEALAAAKRLLENQYGADRVVDVRPYPWRP